MPPAKHTEQISVTYVSGLTVSLYKDDMPFACDAPLALVRLPAQSQRMARNRSPPLRNSKFP